MKGRKIVYGSLCFLWVLGASVGLAAVDFKEGQITTLKNLVEHDQGSGPAAAKMNEKVRENSKVITASSSMAELTFADTSITRIGANSVFSFQSRERLVKLDKGTILIHSVPGNGGATVDCGGVTAAVSGSTFMASRSASGTSLFVLLESSGKLKVTTPSGQVAEIRPGQAASTGSAPNSKIQVYDIDVGKVMDTSPLIRTFKNPLPSEREIEQVTEQQQALIKEGKIEVLGLEVVATTVEGGEPLTGMPRERNTDNDLDIDTAAGGEGPSALPPPKAVAAGPNPGDSRGSLIDPSLLNSLRDRQEIAAPAPEAPTRLALTLPDSVTENEIRSGLVSLDRPAVQATPVTFAYTYNGETRTKSVTIPAGATTASFDFDVPDDAIIRNGSSSSVPVTVTAFAGTLTAQAGVSVLDGTSRTINPATAVVLPPTPPTLGDPSQQVTINLPAALAQGTTATISLSTQIQGNNGPALSTQSMGPASITAESTFTRKVTVAVPAGEKMITIRGDQLPELRVDAGAEMVAVVKLEIPGLDALTFNLNVVPPAIVQIPAVNLARGMQNFGTTWLEWSPVAGAVGYSVEPADPAKLPVFTFDTAYIWPGLLGTDGGMPSTDYRVFANLNASLANSGPMALLPDNLFSTLDAPLALFAGSLELTLHGTADTLVLRDDPLGGFLRLVGPDGLLGQNVATVNYDDGTISWIDSTPVTDLVLTDWSSGFTYIQEAEGLTLDQDPAEPTSAELAGLDRYFFFVAKAAGNPDGPSSYFAQAPSTVDFSVAANWTPVTGLLPGQTFDFVAAREKIIHPGGVTTAFGLEGVTDLSMYAPRIELAGVLGFTGVAGAVDVNLHAGANGYQVNGWTADLGGADFTLDTSAGAEVVASTIRAEMGGEVIFSAKEAIQVRDTTLEKSPTSPGAGSLAVIRTGDKVEVRNVVIRDFARAEVVSVSPENKGRVLLAGSLPVEFRIQELVGAVLAADGKRVLAADSNTRIVASGGDLTIEGQLPVAGADVTGFAHKVHGHSVHLEAQRVALSSAQITAMNQITAKAQTLLVDSSILRVVNAAGSINLYSTQGLVNRQYGTVVEGLVNFAGANTFQIGSNEFQISSSADLLNALQTGKIIEGNTSGVPIPGAVNVMPTSASGSLVGGGS